MTKKNTRIGELGYRTLIVFRYPKSLHVYRAICMKCHDGFISNSPIKESHHDC